MQNHYDAKFINYKIYRPVRDCEELATCILNPSIIWSWTIGADDYGSLKQECSLYIQAKRSIPDKPLQLIAMDKSLKTGRACEG